LRIADCGFNNRQSAIRNPQSAIRNQEMDNPDEKDFIAAYLNLRAANDKLRESGKQALWNMLDLLCSEFARKSAEKTPQASIQVGRQEWQFKVGGATMIGERFGARYRNRTLTIEVGWPRLPEHGFVTQGGLARARIGLSQNIMIDARTVGELILKRSGQSDPAWYFITNNKVGERYTESHLRNHLKMLVDEFDG
jgi:hypothetical protein